MVLEEIFLLVNDRKVKLEEILHTPCKRRTGFTWLVDFTDTGFLRLRHILVIDASEAII